MKVMKDIKVSFKRDGTTVVTHKGHSVVVGKAERSTHRPGKPGYWVLTSYANKVHSSLYAYYGLRKCDLVPFAVAIYNKMLDEAGIH